MLCTPDETVGSFLETVRFSRTVRPIKTYYLFYLPLPETPLYGEHHPFQVHHADTRFDDGFWNRPNIRLRHINRGQFIMLKTRLTLAKIVSFLANGWRLRRWGFIKDLILFLCGKNRLLPFSNPYFVNELYQNTVLNYFIEDKRAQIMRGGA